MSNLYNNITALCAKKGVKPSRMCLDIGIPKSFMSELKKGKTQSCRPERQEAIAEYFDIPVKVLLFDDLTAESTLSSPLDIEYDVVSSKELKGVKIPVLGKIAAGVPIEAVEEIIDYEEIPAAMAKDGEYIALQIKGDSMEPRLTTGDVVIIRKQETVDSGQIAAVMINGNDATIKKVVFRSNGITLIPLNPKYEPMNYSSDDIKNLPITIIGRVVEARCKL